MSMKGVCGGIRQGTEMLGCHVDNRAQGGRNSMRQNVNWVPGKDAGWRRETGCTEQSVEESR